MDDYDNLVFLYNGHRLRPELTPDDKVDMENGAGIEAIIVGAI
ncbi:unnamed protein product [Arabidopsis thaliana]|uniref:(thale cress) hypothetical protein n=1 Tax=Arabidopsis thaliana TaxID=3702 RepID=A0A7G2FGS4_ARATH|nr:unnamed protein product [Arabidopsis thaliana]